MLHRLSQHHGRIAIVLGLCWSLPVVGCLSGGPGATPGQTTQQKPPHIAPPVRQPADIREPVSAESLYLSDQARALAFAISWGARLNAEIFSRWLQMEHPELQASLPVVLLDSHGEVVPFTTRHSDPHRIEVAFKDGIARLLVIRTPERYEGWDFSSRPPGFWSENPVKGTSYTATLPVIDAGAGLPEAGLIPLGIASALASLPDLEGYQQGDLRELLRLAVPPQTIAVLSQEVSHLRVLRRRGYGWVALVYEVNGQRIAATAQSGKLDMIRKPGGGYELRHSATGGAGRSVHITLLNEVLISSQTRMYAFDDPAQWELLTTDLSAL